MSAVPQLRYMLRSRVKLHLALAFGIGIGITVGVKLFHNNKRIKAYEDFRASYNPKADYDRMKQAGVFHSLTPAGKVTVEAWK